MESVGFSGNNSRARGRPLNPYVARTPSRFPKGRERAMKSTRTTTTIVRQQRHFGARSDIRERVASLLSLSLSLSLALSRSFFYTPIDFFGAPFGRRKGS
jgi:hypothetical protein